MMANVCFDETVSDLIHAMSMGEYQHAPVSFLNGAAESMISANSRALAYGHGLFETVRASRGEMPLWQYHKKRLLAGCQRLNLCVDVAELERFRQQALDNAPADAVIKIMILAGSGGRGYVTPQNLPVDYLFQVFPVPQVHAQANNGISLWQCQQRLALQSALAGIKHLNRLEQILARAEQSSETYPEGVMLDTQSRVIEAISANIFCYRDGCWQTPSLTHCGVAGVMREYLLAELLPEAAVVDHLLPSQLAEAEEVFVCNSVKGIVPVVEVAELARWPVGARTQQLQRALSRELPCFAV
jgi:4-amino-4-deoxychorismate lyase